MAIESLPVSAGITASSDLLPSKDIPQVPRRVVSHDLQGDRLWMAPWEQGLEVIPAFFEFADPLGQLASGQSPFLKVLAGEGEEGLQAGDSGQESGPDDEAEESPVDDSAPDGEVGIDPPSETDESWVPAEPADPGLDLVDSGPGGGEPRDLLPIEREQGNCVITGEVSDVTTLEPIAGASVVVIGQGREDITDAQGRFSIGGLPPGDYTVEALKLEYSMGEAAASPRPGSPAEVRISLRKKPAVDTADGEYLLAAESVVGEYREDSAGDLFLDLEVAPKLASGLTNEDFSRVAVGDAGEAVSKISGVNVVGGKYAVVRGLTGRYITTTLNNAAVTSADPSQKTIQLDLLPTSVIQNIAVAKTYDVMLPGDFGGGAINIETLAMPTERFFNTSYKLETNSNLDSPFYRHPDRELDYWGDVDTPVGDVLGGRDPSSDVDAAGDLLQAAAFKGRLSSTRPTESYGIAYGDVIDITDYLKFGLVASFAHETKDSMITGVTRNPLPDPNERRGYTEDQFISSVDWSLFLAGFLQVGDNHRFQYNHFKKKVAEDVITRGTDVIDSRFYSGLPLFGNTALLDGLGGAPAYGVPAVLRGEFWDTDTIVRDLEFNQFLGEHTIGDDGPTVSWGFSTNDSSEARPNNTTFNTTLLDFTDPVLSDPDAFLDFQAVEINQILVDLGRGLDDPTIPGIIDEANDLIANGNRIERFFGAFILGQVDDAIEESENLESNPDLGVVPTVASNELGGADNLGDMTSSIQQKLITETSEEFFADASWPIRWGEENSLTFKAGFRNLDKLRKARATIYDVDTESNIPTDELLTPGGIGEQAGRDPEVLANNPEYTSIVDNTGTGRVENFDGFSDLFGAYFGADLDWEWLQMTSGVRYELEERGYELLGTDDPRQVPSQKGVWLPSFGVLTNTFSDRLTFGAFYSRTVARPTFFEFLPARTVDQRTGFTRSGNPELQDTSIENFDVSFGLQLFEQSSISVSPFYKKLSDPIISEVDFFQRVITYDNGENGTLAGVELEAEFAEWESWILRGNYTYINSTLESFFDIDGGGPQDPVLVSQQYPGQPEHIFNLLLGYENEEYGWGANLIYNYTGENVLFRRRTPDDPFVEVPGFHQLDANLTKTFEFDNMDLSVVFTVKNILDSQTEHIFVGGVQGYEGIIYDEFRPGRSFSIELKASF